MKEHLELGKPGADWETGHLERITAVIRSIWDEQYPNVAKDTIIDAIIDAIQEKYITTRHPDGLRSKIKSLIDIDPYLRYSVTVKNFTICREWSLNRKRSQTDGPCRIALESKDNQFLYIHPTDMIADFGAVFKDIFMANPTDNHSRNELLKKIDIKENRYFKFDDEKMIEIPISGDVSNSILNTAAYFIIDYLLARVMYGKTSKQQTRIVDAGILDSIKRIGYRSVLLNNVNAFHTDSENSVFYRQLKGISESIPKDGKSVKIPEYCLDTNAIFELYCYSVLLRKNNNITYQQKITKGTIPDFLYKKDNMTIEFDAKNKYQYAGGICEKKDIIQFAKRMKAGSTSGCIIYPTIKENADDDIRKWTKEDCETNLFNMYSLSYPKRPDAK